MSLGKTLRSANRSQEGATPVLPHYYPHYIIIFIGYDIFRFTLDSMERYLSSRYRRMAGFGAVN